MLLLISHGTGRLRHMAAARHLRRRLAEAAGNDINAIYDETFKHNIEFGGKGDVSSKLFHVVMKVITSIYDWLFVVFGTGIFLKSLLAVVAVLPSRL